MCPGIGTTGSIHVNFRAVTAPLRGREEQRQKGGVGTVPVVFYSKKRKLEVNIIKHKRVNSEQWVL